jgi:hypothetical protein
LNIAAPPLWIKQLYHIALRLSIPKFKKFAKNFKIVIDKATEVWRRGVADKQRRKQKT